MTTSTDAIFAWGIPLDEDAMDDLVNGQDTDEDEVLEELRKTLKEEFGCSLIRHCSYDFPQFFLAFGEETTATRGEPKRLNGPWTSLPDAAAPALQAAIEKHKLTPAEGAVPGFWIMSMWG